jgi:hypothetical protein
MIRLLAHPLLSHQQARHRKTEKERQLAKGEEGKACMGEEPNQTTAGKPGLL